METTMNAALNDERLSSIGHCRPLRMIAVLVATDCFSLALSGLLALAIKGGVKGVSDITLYAMLIPFIFLFLAAFSALGFYSGVSLTSPEELRRSTFACMFTSLAVAISTAFMRPGHVLFTRTMAVAIALSFVLVPLFRELIRIRLSRSAWWGYPAVIFGDLHSAVRIAKTLQRQMGVGLKPVALLCAGGNGIPAASVDGIPIIDEFSLGEIEPQLRGRGYALLAGNTASCSNVMSVVMQHRRLFPHLLIIPEAWEFPCVSVTPKNVGGILGLEVREQLFHPGKRLLKRALDLSITAATLTFLFPCILTIAIAIKLSSPGPVFYGQRRIGRGGVEFQAWKFRSMVAGADAVLARHLRENPVLAQEWERNHKLRHDPRITPVGRFLRKTSLDELPQLWNVLRGDMSLVGPRPIVRDEIPKYGKYFDVYTSVLSGVTGLWQVSGRSETSYDQRVDFDTFYVRNWSVWLDLHILFRTLGVVWLRTGAY